MRGERWGDDEDPYTESVESDMRATMPSPKRSRKTKVDPEVNKKPRDRGRSASRPAPYKRI
jgi:hypothetical protein